MRGKLALSYAPVNGLKQGLWKGVALFKFLGVALYGKRRQYAGGAWAAGCKGHDLFSAAAVLNCCLRILDVIPTSYKLAGRQPASIGRLRAGRPETRVNSGLADRLPGTPRKHWAGGQVLRRRPFYAGFGAGVMAGL